MSRDRQIEEMAKIINKPCFEIMNEAGATDRDCPFPYGCEECTATNLYNAGYRKASEVAREIFAEVANAWANSWTESEFLAMLKKLKKKYIGKDTNVTTNTEEEK